MKIDVGLVPLSIDRLERLVENFGKIKDRICEDSKCNPNVVLNLINDIETIKDHIRYHKELNRDIPRIQKTF
jgi:hypothetical protein